MVFQRSFKDVSCKFQEKEVSGVLQESFRRLSRKIEGCFEGVLRMFHGHFKGFIDV